MARSVAILLSFALCFALFSCSNNSNSSGSETASVPRLVGMKEIQGYEIVGNEKYQGTTDTDGLGYLFMPGYSTTLHAFYISDHETTQKEYYDVMGTNPSFFNNKEKQLDTDNFKISPIEKNGNQIQPDNPVENVSWYDAIVYCNKRSMLEGFTPCYKINGSTNPASWGTPPYFYTSYDDEVDKELKAVFDVWEKVELNPDANGYRLPTEAEWEYAARGGAKGMAKDVQDKYAGGNTMEDVAWCRTNSGNKTHAVKTKAANGLGLYDMSGNVIEWCYDIIYDINNEPILRSFRGGNFISVEEDDDDGQENMYDNLLEVSQRNLECSYPQSYCLPWIGFRVARNK